ncbi:MAG: fibronectin type III domain-containing protein [Anaerolineae bacterium]|nr:fibronectin type III domain-containing protein [Anaerolineae bacterium]
MYLRAWVVFSRRVGILLFLLPLLIWPSDSSAQTRYIRAQRLGITFISSLDHPANDLRYQRALLLGAGWNRWPLYWDRVETMPNTFNWAGYDRLVSEDIQHGLSVNVILLGRPGFHADGGSISGLRSPAFADGTDTPGAGKMPNPANPWAVFVYNAVMRYKPGGYLATSERWPAGTGVTVWEAWNEPDLSMFWTGGVENYARLLKVTYLVAHQADPSASVMFGGLAYGNPDEDDWLSKVLDVISTDPLRQMYNWYMDMVGVHNYSYARRTGLIVQRVKENLARYNLNRPIWLNESGVPVWDDYPGPVWAGRDPASRRFRATMQQQANFVVESTVLAWAAGAEVVFIHQLYDDCGNQAGGTNFPPHNGELCAVNSNCAGDAYGLYRNERGEACFSQHALPGSPRPAAGAFYRLAQIFGAFPFNNPNVEYRDGATIVSFDRPSTGQRVLVLWNRTLERINLAIPALGSAAQLYDAGNQDWSLNPTDGLYTIGLEAATRDDYPFLPAGEVSGIAGAPFILIEKVDPIVATPAAPLVLTPGSITATQPPRPTVDPALDTTPPTAAVIALPVISPPTFTVTWSGQDDSGIDRYLIWVRVDGGDWQPWLETASTQGQFTGQAGSTYEFSAWAIDLGGNWSLNTELSPQAMTAVQ